MQGSFALATAGERSGVEAIKRVVTVVSYILWIYSSAEIQGSFEKMPSYFAEIPGSIVKMQGSFALSTGT